MNAKLMAMNQQMAPSLSANKTHYQKTNVSGIIYQYINLFAWVFFQPEAPF